MTALARWTTRDASRLALAGLFTWLVVGAALFLRHAASPCTLLAYGGFFVFFVVLSGAWLRSRRLILLALVLQSACAVVLASQPLGGTAQALLVVVACEVPLLLSPAAAPLLLVGQTLALLASQIASAGELAGEMLVQAGTMLGFQAFGAAAATFAVRERAARQEVAQVHAELVATRGLVAEEHRAGERLRIARELHDVLGHHLTALVINLEVARNAGVDERDAAVQRAQAIARGMLAEVRETVSVMRHSRPLDLESALRTLALALPDLSVHLSVVGEQLEDPATAHALVRCVQEVLTNCARHAEARNVWIDVTHDRSDHIPHTRLLARDDGRGDDHLRPGNGLAGMKERIGALGGALVIDSAAGRGTTIRVEVPATGEPA